jgi:NAD(P)-dependent dehydrogenase (short-subunit alcohol dehydrogenase family)
MSQAEQGIQPIKNPPQSQDQQPGLETEMVPKPDTEPRFRGADRLKGKVALITGGDSGIGRAVARAFAREGADVAISYLNEHQDAADTKKLIEEEGRRCITIPGDIGSEDFCKEIVDRTVRELGGLDILVNNAAEQHVQESVEDISAEQLERTFRTNIFSQFYLTKAAMPHLKKGSAIINTTSITAFRGKPELMDYASTKGAILAFTRSLAQECAEKGIRVNAVAPGPIWTPLIPASFDPKKVEEFGSNTLMKRAGQPNEVAPAYVFLASEDASYITGQTIHPNGGEIVNT